MRTPLTILSTIAATLCLAAAPAVARAGHTTTRHTDTKTSTAHHRAHKTNRHQSKHHRRRAHKAGPHATRTARRAARKRIRRHIVTIRHRPAAHRHSSGKATTTGKTTTGKTTTGKTTTGKTSTGTSTTGTSTTGKTTSGTSSTGTAAGGTNTSGTTAGGANSSGSATTTSLSSGGSVPFFAGTFTSPDEWPSVYGGCAQAVTNTDVQFDITTACNPAGDGHYRTDLCSSRSCDGNGSISAGDVYQAGQPTCTSIPVDAINVPTVPTSGWMMFAEAKDNSARTAGWAFMINSQFGGVNQFSISFGTGISNTAWFGTMSSGWHTLSICTNNANSSAGEVYGIYEDGQPLTFNSGTGAGQQSVGGFPIINNGMSSWPLDIDDYTGGAPSNTIITGAPLVSAGPDNPPMPAGGWNHA